MNICVCGIGKAGKAIIEKILKLSQYKLCSVISKDGTEEIGKDLGEFLNTTYLDIPILSLYNCEREIVDKKIDIIVDFSSHTATIPLLKLCNKVNSKLIICTTNHSELTIEEIKKFTLENKLGVIYAPNLTLGINLLMDFVADLSKILLDFDFEIIERHCKDKPKITTTAKIISKKINRGDINISSVRVGGYVGIHEVTCANENERITIIHESFTRQAFANGAMLAVDFIKDKKGFYLMDDVINELKKNRGV